MKNNILIIILLLTSVTYGQKDIHGKVIKITGANSFSISTEEKNTYEVFLADLQPYTEDVKINSAINYLKETILDKIVYVMISYEKENNVSGSVLYNCKQLDNIKYQNGQLPCSEGNVLDVEMLKLDLLKYTGNNEFLKKIR